MNTRQDSAGVRDVSHIENENKSSCLYVCERRIMFEQSDRRER